MIQSAIISIADILKEIKRLGMKYEVLNHNYNSWSHTSVSPGFSNLYSSLSIYTEVQRQTASGTKKLPVSGYREVMVCLKEK